MRKDGDTRMPFYETIGTWIVLLTPAGGCYNNMTGTVAGYRAGNLEPVENPIDSRYALIRFDRPAANCGEIETIFPWSQVFPAGTTGTYWKPERPANSKGG